MPETAAPTPEQIAARLADLDAWAMSDVPEDEWAAVSKPIWRLRVPHDHDPNGGPGSDQCMTCGGFAEVVPHA